jgi:hypothetical protein
VKDGLTQHLAGLGRNPSGFNPIELVSAKPEDNLLVPILGDAYPFKVCAKYTINTRTIQGRPCLVIDCSTRTILKENGQFFLNAGFDLVGRYVVMEQENGYRKLLGSVSPRKGEALYVRKADGEVEQVDATDIYLESGRENFDAYILHTHGTQKDAIGERIRQAIHVFNGGENKKARIDILKKYIQSKTIALIDGTRIEIEDAPDIQKDCVQMQKPVFVFNDKGEADWTEKGLTQFGSYTKRTFDRNDASICVICAQHDKGRVEQFVRKLLKGMSNSKYFSNGLEGKFALGTSRVEVFNDIADEVNLQPVGQKNPRMDLYLPSLHTVIEVKYRKDVKKSFPTLIGEIAEDASLYRADAKYKDARIVGFLWDCTRATQGHAKFREGVLKIEGISGCVVVSAPSTMNEQLSN